MLYKYLSQNVQFTMLKKNIVTFIRLLESEGVCYIKIQDFILTSIPFYRQKTPCKVRQLSTIILTEKERAREEKYTPRLIDTLRYSPL